MASLGLVSPGVATEGATPIFSWKKWPPFCLLLSLLLISLGCHHLEGVTPHLSYLSDLLCPLFFVNLPWKLVFLRVSPPRGVTRGGPPLPVLLVTPLCFLMPVVSLTLVAFVKSVTSLGPSWWEKATPSHTYVTTPFPECRHPNPPIFLSRSGPRRQTTSDQ